MSWPRYPEYKESGLDWLPKVPSHWRGRKISWDLPYAIGWTPPSGKEEYYDGEHPWVTIADMGKGVIRDTASKISDLAIQERKAESVPAGSLLFSFKLSVGKVAILKTDAYTNEAIAAFKPNDKVDLHFWKYAGPEVIPKYSRENIYGAMLLNQDLIRSVRFFAPPISEQRVIAGFLDHETAKIDALIEEQQRLIQLLEQKRQAVISHAVTKGLDPDAPMKDSGVECLGRVPRHWNLLPLKFLTPVERPIMYGIVLPGPDFSGGVPIVKGGDVKPERLTLERLNRTDPIIESKYARSRLLPGDIVYSIRGGIGDVELVPEELEFANITQDAARISPISNINRRWLLMVLKSRAVFGQLEAGAVGATIRGINIFDLKRAKIPVPPASEQVEIASYLSQETSIIDSLFEETAKTIQLLSERRSALISAAVTGKIDVRNWQSEPGRADDLPMAAEEPAAYETSEP